MKLYTKRGDNGSTGLIGDARVSKHDLRVAAYGGVDEINATIGIVISACEDDETADVLRRIQSDLFILGAELATPPGKDPDTAIEDSRIAQLERWIDEASGEIEPLGGFILPGGCETAARLHLARTVCRRGERAAVALAMEEKVGRAALVYLNRLSDLLFALARRANRRAGIADVPWKAP
jgi:cob(I)alamin adenosyltransferase